MSLLLNGMIQNNCSKGEITLHKFLVGFLLSIVGFGVIASQAQAGHRHHYHGGGNNSRVRVEYSRPTYYTRSIVVYTRPSIVYVQPVRPVCRPAMIVREHNRPCWRPSYSYDISYLPAVIRHDNYRPSSGTSWSISYSRNR